MRADPVLHDGLEWAAGCGLLQAQGLAVGGCSVTIADAVRVLRAHNAWRRDETGELAQQDPRDIGEAIDVLCCFVDSDGESCYLSDGDEG